MRYRVRKNRMFQLATGKNQKKIYIVLVPYIDSAHNMDTPNIFKSNKFYRHMALRARKEKQLKR